MTSDIIRSGVCHICAIYPELKPFTCYSCTNIHVEVLKGLQAGRGQYANASTGKSPLESEASSNCTDDGSVEID